MNKWFYLGSIFMFLGIASICYLSLATKRDKRALKRYELVLVIMVIFGSFFAVTESFALHWRAWFYYPDQTLGIQPGAEIETYLFSAIMAGLLAVATLVGSARFDNRLRKASRKRTRRR